MSNKNYASAWRTDARARSRETSPNQAVEVQLDGFSFIGRRLDLQAWIKGGRIPQGLTEQLIRVHKGEQGEIEAEELSAADLIASVRFQRDAICAVLVKPHIVPDGEPLVTDEDMHFADAFGECPERIDTIMQWILAGSPGIPVQLDNGEVTTVEAVETFRDGVSGEADEGARDHVSKLRPSTKRNNRTQGK